jgi:hypothetical protein
MKRNILETRSTVQTRSKALLFSKQGTKMKKSKESVEEEKRNA